MSVKLLYVVKSDKDILGARKHFRQAFPYLKTRKNMSSLQEKALDPSQKMSITTLSNVVLKIKDGPGGVTLELIRNFHTD